jgi:signal transduction histidine kinase
MKKNIKIVTAIDENVPKITCDPELVERVFSNLISNALKFTPEEGTITVSLRATGESLEGSVADTGEGIPADCLTKIFDKFQQVQGQHKGGTGLGLTICRHIVEAHTGKIWVESEIGKGSSFKFTLPRKLANAQPAQRLQINDEKKTA